MLQIISYYFYYHYLSAINNTAQSINNCNQGSETKINRG